jgi:hypothetical protein
LGCRKILKPCGAVVGWLLGHSIISQNIIPNP